MFNYIVMPRLGMNINQLIELRAANFNKAQIYSFGVQIVNILEKIHRAGFVYNDLKLDNILLDFNKMEDDDLKNIQITDADDIFDAMNLNIIDYGFATSYLDESTKKHISK